MCMSSRAEGPGDKMRPRFSRPPLPRWRTKKCASNLVLKLIVLWASFDEMEIRPVTQRAAPYKAFISGASYEKYSILNFTEYLEQANSPQLRDQRNSVQHTAQASNAKGPKIKGTSSRGQDVDSSLAPVLHGAADSEIQFPRISRISFEDQEKFLEEYRSILRGDLGKLELNKMKTVQELKRLVLAEQEEYQQFAYQQARAHYEMYNMLVPDVKTVLEVDMSKSNKACVQDYPQYYSLCQTLGLSVGAVYKSDPIMQHEQTVLQLGNVPLLCFPDNLNSGWKLLSRDDVSAPKVSSEINVARKQPLSQDATALNLAKQHKADLVVTSEALKTLIDNQGPDYTEQWELPVCVKLLTDIEESAAEKSRKVIFIDDPLPKKLLTPYRVNCDFYRRSLRKLLCQGMQGGHCSLPKQSNEETTVPVCRKKNNNSVDITPGISSFSSTEGDSSGSDKREQSCDDKENLSGGTRFCSVAPLQENVSSFSHQMSSKLLKVTDFVGERCEMETSIESKEYNDNFCTEGCNSVRHQDNFSSRRESDVHTVEQSKRQRGSIEAFEHESETKKLKFEDIERERLPGISADCAENASGIAREDLVTAHMPPTLSGLNSTQAVETQLLNESVGSVLSCDSTEAELGPGSASAHKEAASSTCPVTRPTLNQDSAEERNPTRAQTTQTTVEGIRENKVETSVQSEETVEAKATVLSQDTVGKRTLIPEDKEESIAQSGAERSAPILHPKDSTEKTSTVEHIEVKENKPAAPNNEEETATQGKVEQSDPTLHPGDVAETTSIVDYKETEQEPAAPENEEETATQDKVEQSDSTLHQEDAAEIATSAVDYKETEQEFAAPENEEETATQGKVEQSDQTETTSTVKYKEIGQELAVPENEEKAAAHGKTEQSDPTLHQEDAAETATSVVEYKDTEQEPAIPTNEEKAATHGKVEQSSQILHQGDAAETTSAVKYKETEQKPAALKNEEETFTQGKVEQSDSTLHQEDAAETATLAVKYKETEQEPAVPTNEEKEAIQIPVDLQTSEAELVHSQDTEQTGLKLKAQNSDGSTLAVTSQDQTELTVLPVHPPSKTNAKHTGMQKNQVVNPLNDEKTTSPKCYLVAEQTAVTDSSQTAAEAKQGVCFHMDNTENSRNSEENPANLRSDGRKRSAASTEHSKDEDNNLSSTKVPRYEDHTKQQTVQSVQESSQLTDSIVYTLWRFGKLKILVQTSLDAYRENQSKPNSYVFFSVMPKLEYQPSLGFARFNLSETSRFWLHSYLRPNTRLLCGRINIHNSELMKIDELELSDILNSGLMFNPARGMKMVWQVLNGLSPLSEGKYLLCHAPRDIHCCLYACVGCGTAINRRSVYDLHHAHSTVGEVIAFSETEIPWVAMDTNSFLPNHIVENRIPCTFPSVSARRLAELQAAEKLKESKAQKTKKKGRRSKKKRAQQKAGVNKSHNTHPASNSPRKKSKARQQKKGPPGVELPTHFSLDNLVSSGSDERGVSRAGRKVAPITYDDIDFGEL